MINYQSLPIQSELAHQKELGLFSRVSLETQKCCAQNLEISNLAEHADVACEYSRFSLLLIAWDVSQERRMRISDRNSILMTLNLSGGIWSGALIGRRIVVTLFQLSYTNDDEKQRERTNGNAINLLQNSLYSWNIYGFFKKKHSRFAGACAKKNIKLRHNQIDKEKLIKSNKFIFRTAELPD